MTLGERMKIFRTKEGMTQKELARKCGISSTYISDIETGVKVEDTIEADLIDKINSIIGTDYNDTTSATDRNILVGKKIHDARIYRHKSTKEVGRMIGLTGSQYYRLEGTGFSKTDQKTRDKLIFVMPEIKKYFDYTLEDFENEKMILNALYNRIIDIIEANITNYKELNISQKVYTRFKSKAISYETLCEIICNFIVFKRDYKDKLLELLEKYTEKVGLVYDLSLCVNTRILDIINADIEEDTIDKPIEKAIDDEDNTLEEEIRECNLSGNVEETVYKTVEKVFNIKPSTQESEIAEHNLFESDEERNTVIALLYDSIDSYVSVPYSELPSPKERESIAILAKWFDREISKSERLMLKVKEYENR